MRGRNAARNDAGKMGDIRRDIERYAAAGRGDRGLLQALLL
jgi:hypothetical protein